MSHSKKTKNNLILLSIESAYLLLKKNIINIFDNVVLNHIQSHLKWKILALKLLSV